MAMAMANGPAKLRKTNDVTIKYGQRLLPQVVDTFAAEEPDYILGMMPKPGANSSVPIDFITLSTSQLSNAINFMSHWLDRTLGKSNSVTGQTIAYVGSQDFRYLVMECASIKTGHPLLIPSPRNAPTNTASLLERTNCKIVFYSGLFGEQKDSISEFVGGLEFFEIPSLEEITLEKTMPYPYTKSWEEAKNDVFLILHTSGSTGNPKPITLTNSFMRRMDCEHIIPPVDGRTLASLDLCRPGTTLLLGTNFYHLSGVAFTVSALFHRYTVIAPPADRLLDGQTISNIFKTTEVSGAALVPSLCDSVFAERGEEIIEHLRSLEHINWLGGPLGHSTGEWIIKNLPNVRLWQIFGSTETMMIPMLIPPKSHWSYMEFHPKIGPHLELVDAEEGLYEVVWRRHPDLNFAWTTPVFDFFPEEKEWRTRDLMRKCTDTGFENCWKFESRLDDILVLHNGLKANPVHIETRLQSHPILKGCLVFGEGYTACGLLLEPKRSDIASEKLIELVWPAVVDANALVPEHVRVARNLVIVASPDKPLVRAGKGTVVRRLTTRLYQKEIEETYR
ncbi:uncharacterized protein BP5553_10521 [Venustampulla echinocandica]|uniref:AMP-dependent synthetase/ligase domain-containing protein n=1 Tax=Venustampulla echinocandica TaxID=2656787 RepID=A0A370T8S4_9HELO|nr:uncharacterized protein BP5553_10521 [Venustampulla echinocandica]RDL29894.1 hypothetical protein BP5553_10521 [Venustampulla echinocandica]